MAVQDTVQNKLIPNAIDLAYTTVIHGVTRLFYQDKKPPINMTGVGNTYFNSAGNFNYSNITAQRSLSNKPVELTIDYMRDYNKIKYASALEAQQVLNAMQERISQCQCVSMKEFYDFAGVETDDFNLDNWGWTTLKHAQLSSSYDGTEYYIRLPRAEKLK
jgi:hypothetical protein